MAVANFPVRETTIEPESPVARHMAGFAREAGRALEWLVGLGMLVVGLAILVTVPLLQWVAVGYLFHSAGNVARGARLREAFPGIRLAARLGLAIIGLWITILPTRILMDRLAGVRLLDPNAAGVDSLALLVTIVAALTLLNALVALARGGRLRDFFWPVGNLTWTWNWLRGRSEPALTCSRESLLEGGREIVRLGVVGLVGSLATAVWLVPPSLLLAAGVRRPGLGVLGAWALALVVLYLPILQARYSAYPTWRSMFHRRSAVRLFQRTPILWLFAFVLLVVLATPLYLFKIELPPREYWWLLSLAFVGTIWPLKLLSAWIYARAERRPVPAAWPLRWAAWLVMMLAALLYAYIAFLSQYIGWRGMVVLFQHHAFLLPSPF